MTPRITLVCVPDPPRAVQASADSDPGCLSWHSTRARAIDLYARMQVLLELSRADRHGVLRDLEGARDAALLAGVASAMAGTGSCVAPRRDVALALALGATPLDVVRAPGSIPSRTILDARGIALRARLRGVVAPVVCVFESGALSLRPFVEAATAAVAGALPVVFVCEREAWCRPRGESDAARDVSMALEIPIREVDGMDAECVAREIALASGFAVNVGPVFVDATTHGARSAQPGARSNPAECLRRSAIARGLADRREFDACDDALDRWLGDASLYLRLQRDASGPSPDLFWLDGEPA